jgi:thymidylate synthase (FAD)
MRQEVNFINLTTDAEKTMAYLARVSSSDQRDDVGLLKYCAEHGHWSVFEMAHMTVEIKTSRAIAAQILRHKSFSFQEFSQRYASVTKDSYIEYDARSQDNKNRQNSIDNLSDPVKDSFRHVQQVVWESCHREYQALLKQGVAKECARMILPLNTMSRLYMCGSIRSWIHYLQVRGDGSTQLEHREIADKVKDIFRQKLPTTYKSCFKEDK